MKIFLIVIKAFVFRNIVLNVTDIEYQTQTHIEYMMK